MGKGKKTCKYCGAKRGKECVKERCDVCLKNKRHTDLVVCPVTVSEYNVCGKCYADAIVAMHEDLCPDHHDSSDEEDCDQCDTECDCSTCN